MAVRIWLGEDFDHFHEWESLVTFYKNMAEYWESDDGDCHMLCNFLVGDSQVDMAVLRHTGLTVVEMKSVGAPIEGGLNGHWVMRTPDGEVNIKAGSATNPFGQVKACRRNLSELLAAEMGVFTSVRRIGGIETRHINAVVALCPVVPEGTSVVLPDSTRPWFRLVGLNELHLTIRNFHCTGLTFENDEQMRLITRVLRLQERDPRKYILGTKPDSEPQRPKVRLIELAEKLGVSVEQISTTLAEQGIAIPRPLEFVNDLAMKTLGKEFPISED